VIYDLLFKASSETVLAIAADPKHLGARIGITAVLHTWGSAVTHHPHAHIIVPGGGISLDGSRWVSCRPRCLLPVRVLSELFRGLMLAKLIAAHKAGQPQFLQPVLIIEEAVGGWPSKSSTFVVMRNASNAPHVSASKKAVAAPPNR
jgi:hypothetical protein